MNWKDEQVDYFDGVGNIEVDEGNGLFDDDKGEDGDDDDVGRGVEMVEKVKDAIVVVVIGSREEGIVRRIVEIKREEEE